LRVLLLGSFLDPVDVIGDQSVGLPVNCAAASADGASTRQKIRPDFSSTQYLR